MYALLVDRGDLYSAKALSHGHIYLQTTLSTCSVCYSCPCKALIQLQKDFPSFLWLALLHFRKLFELPHLSFSNLCAHTHTHSPAALLQTTGGQKKTPLLQDCGSEEGNKKMGSILMWDISAKQAQFQAVQSKMHLYSPQNGYMHKQNSSGFPWAMKALPGTYPPALSQGI